MIAPLVQLSSSHSVSFVLAALAICLVSAWLATALIRRAQAVAAPRRLLWMFLIAIAAGIGVWTTHFIAMLGFRPDILFGYDLPITALSAMVSIVLVGGPMALCVQARERRQLIVLGAVSGLGIGAMHQTGMTALQGCVLATSPLASTFAYLTSAIFFAAAMAVRPTGRGWYVTPLLITLAVAAGHFISMAGTGVVGLSAIGNTAMSGSTVGVIVSGTALLLFAGMFLSVLLTAKLDREARIKTRLLSTALHNMSNGLMMVDERGFVRIFNDRLVELFSFTRFADDIGMRWQDYIRTVGMQLDWSGRWTEGVIANYQRWMAADHPTTVEHALRNGRTLKITCRPLPGGGAVFTYDDVTVERSVQKQITHMAFHDALTGLPNRRTFQRTIEERVADKRPVSMLMLDLDRFKQVNDTLGHGVGDELLVTVAERMRAICSPDDVLARLGGDELAILVDGIEEEKIEALAQRIIAALSEPISIGEHTISIGVSIGIATTADAQDPSMLAQQSDLALYSAKASGRNRAVRYKAGMQEEANERVLLERELASALLREEFTLVYQPLYTLSDRSLIGFEALVRWESPTRGLVRPDEFIPFSEETGQIVEIGDWVLGEACRQVAHWPSHPSISVNVSPVQLQQSGFLASITRALSESGLAAHRLELELTETALVRDGASIAATINALRALGVRIAMDDFGTGYSSLTHLRDFELDRIKIDRSFISAAPTDTAAMAVLRAVTQMGRDLGIPTTGEGVECESQIAMLRDLGCDAAQGFRLGRPMSSRDAARLAGESADRSVALAS